MKPIIFLDFDGVLNTDRHQTELRTKGLPTRDSHGPLFDPVAIENFREITASTDAMIVITSSWRYFHGFQGLQKMWVERTLPGKIHAILPLDTLFPTRGEEIESFLDDYTSAPYIIIDDEDDGFSTSMRERWIQTNPVAGLTQEDVKLAIHLLNDL